MRTFFLIGNIVIIICLSSCTTIPVVNSNWIESNCQSLRYFTPDTYEKSGCYREDITNGIYNCNFSNGDKYIGQSKGGDRHGICKYIWEGGHSFEGLCKDNEFWCGIEQQGSTFFTYINGEYTQSESGIDWDTVGGILLVAGAIYVAAELAEGGGGDYSDNDYKYTCKYVVNGIEIVRDAVYGSCPNISYEEPLMCYRDDVYGFNRYCDEKACGDSCISIWKTCHVGKGTACNRNIRSYP